jgi:hypothetical protein
MLNNGGIKVKQCVPLTGKFKHGMDNKGYEESYLFPQNCTKAPIESLVAYSSCV